MTCTLCKVTESLMWFFIPSTRKTLCLACWRRTEPLPE